MEKSLEKLNELKKQEDLIKKLISNLENQKEKLEIEELNLINVIEKQENRSQGPSTSSLSITTESQTNIVEQKSTCDLNLDPFLKQKFQQQEQIEEEEDDE
ncbi:unnamed protein product [Brachionus calyciflorus]|uniref:Uncharacterized protein n=1 Tax=Brachionus calyciflorus TaxID=104777 RepID=A0A813UHD3_9BILA|nr:unnamed protein product [Brachionus calyciflorus]